jgi:hypothetical protein
MKNLKEREKSLNISIKKIDKDRLFSLSSKDYEYISFNRDPATKKRKRVAINYLRHNAIINGEYYDDFLRNNNNYEQVKKVVNEEIKKQYNYLFI